MANFYLARDQNGESYLPKSTFREEQDAGDIFPLIHEAKVNYWEENALYERYACSRIFYKFFPRLSAMKRWDLNTSSNSANFEDKIHQSQTFLCARTMDLLHCNYGMGVDRPTSLPRHAVTILPFPWSSKGFTKPSLFDSNAGKSNYSAHPTIHFTTQHTQGMTSDMSLFVPTIRFNPHRILESIFNSKDWFNLVQNMSFSWPSWKCDAFQQPGSVFARDDSSNFVAIWDCANSFLRSEALSAVLSAWNYFSCWNSPKERFFMTKERILRDRSEANSEFFFGPAFLEKPTTQCKKMQICQGVQKSKPRLMMIEISATTTNADLLHIFADILEMSTESLLEKCILKCEGKTFPLQDDDELVLSSSSTACIDIFYKMIGGSGRGEGTRSRSSSPRNQQSEVSLENDDEENDGLDDHEHLQGAAQRRRRRTSRSRQSPLTSGSIPQGSASLPGPALAANPTLLPSALQDIISRQDRDALRAIMDLPQIRALLRDNIEQAAENAPTVPMEEERTTTTQPQDTGERAPRHRFPISLEDGLALCDEDNIEALRGTNGETAIETPHPNLSAEELRKILRQHWMVIDSRSACTLRHNGIDVHRMGVALALINASDHPETDICKYCPPLLCEDQQSISVVFRYIPHDNGAANRYDPGRAKTDVLRELASILERRSRPTIGRDTAQKIQGYLSVVWSKLRRCQERKNLHNGIIQIKKDRGVLNILRKGGIIPSTSYLLHPDVPSMTLSEDTTQILETITKLLDPRDHSALQLLLSTSHILQEGIAGSPFFLFHYYNEIDEGKPHERSVRLSTNVTTVGDRRTPIALLVESPLDALKWLALSEFALRLPKGMEIPLTFSARQPRTFKTAMVKSTTIMTTTAKTTMSTIYIYIYISIYTYICVYIYRAHWHIQPPWE